MVILFAILLFSFLIFIHELGHFLAAKLLGVRVNEFSMFMGPAICTWTRGETKYSIRCIPIGGYCAMEGEDGESDDPRAFGSAKRWKRLIILVAGSFMNFLTGLVIIAIFLFNQPKYVSTQLNDVYDDSNLRSAQVEQGLLPGDEILEIDGDSIRLYEDFNLKIMLMQEGHYDILVNRDGKEILLKDVLMQRRHFFDTDPREEVETLVGVDNKEDIRSVAGMETVENIDDYYVGYMFGVEFAAKDTTFGSVVEQTIPTAMYYTDTVIVSLKMLITGQAGLKDVNGPVGIVQTMSNVTDSAETTKDAVMSMLWFAGFIAINLAVMNMLPFPALDGGRVLGLVLTAIIEGITRKKLNPKYEGIIHGVGMLLLLALMAIIMFKDIFVLFKG